jgi:hypothetical protein
MKLKYLVAVAFLAVLFVFGFFRVYYGKDIGFKIVSKYSFGYHDTIVNLDDILGQPRIVVAIQHPEVKRQLEEMGLIDTDKKALEKLRQHQKNR